MVRTGSRPRRDSTDTTPSALGSIVRDLDQHTSDSWWKFLGSGAVVLALLVAVTTITGELPEGWWVVAMGTLLLSLVSIAFGLVLGAVHLRRG
jgi:uncharacterized membrane protein YedE/YeeE